MFPFGCFVFACFVCTALGTFPKITTVRIAPTLDRTNIQIFRPVAFNPSLFFTIYAFSASVEGVHVTAVSGGRASGCDYLTANIFNSSRFDVVGNMTLDLNIRAKAPPEGPKFLPDILAVVMNVTLSVCNVPEAADATWALTWNLNFFESDFENITWQQYHHENYTWTWEFASGLGTGSRNYPLRTGLSIRHPAVGRYVASLAVGGPHGSRCLAYRCGWSCSPRRPHRADASEVRARRNRDLHAVAAGAPRIRENRQRDAPRPDPVRRLLSQRPGEGGRWRTRAVDEPRPCDPQPLPRGLACAG